MIGGFFPLKNILIPTGIRLKRPGILNIPIDFIGITFSLSLPLLLLESTKPSTCLAPLLFNIPIFSAVVLKDIILSIGFTSVGHLSTHSPQWVQSQIPSALLKFITLSSVTLSLESSTNLCAFASAAGPRKFSFEAQLLQSEQQDAHIIQVDAASIRWKSSVDCLLSLNPPSSPFNKGGVGGISSVTSHGLTF